MATPKLAMIPTAYKPTKLYSVLPQSGVGDFTFARASAATRVNEDGLIETINPNFIGNELVTNGSFTGGSTGWVLGSGWAYSSNAINATSTSSVCYQDIASMQSNKIYTVTYQISNYSGGNIQWRFGGTGTVDGATRNANGVYTEYFTNTSSGDKRFFLSPSGFTGTIDNVSVKEVTLNNIPRLDYTDGGCPNFLLEPQRTNLIEYSDDFSQSYWTKGNSSIVSNNAISPDGTLNADKLVEDTQNVAHITYASPNVTLGNNTFSVFAKAAERRVLGIEFPSNGILVSFDLIDGVFVNQQASPDNFSITPFSNGWYRIDITENLTSSSVVALSLRDENGNRTYQGDGTSGLYIYGAQLESGTYPTSYIPTNGSTVTRVAETCTGSGDASTFNDSEGVFMAEISAFKGANEDRQISISDGSNSNKVGFQLMANGTQIQFYTESGGSNQVNTFKTIDATNGVKIGFSYKVNDFKVYLNGFLIVTDTSGAVPIGLNELAFDRGTGGDKFYGKTKQLQYYNSVLTNAELETLTSWQSFLEMANGQNYTII